MRAGARCAQEAYRLDLTLAEAEVLALSTLKQVMEEKVGRVWGPGGRAGGQDCDEAGAGWVGGWAPWPMGFHTRWRVEERGKQRAAL